MCLQSPSIAADGQGQQHGCIPHIDVPAPSVRACMQIELMQVGPRGDLVVGSDELRVISITAKGTIVHWFELKTSSRMLGAELCLVLRYLSGRILLDGWRALGIGTRARGAWSARLSCVHTPKAASMCGLAMWGPEG